ncbi:hypothetical protein BX600DRAFT_551202 [Xylariales sp. PMI_506]|nr:hypothetical protein BX600DRAFT_551202 [Xylariales sp. PMI_506]
MARSLVVPRSQLDGLPSFIPWYANQDGLDDYLLVLDDLSFDDFSAVDETSLLADLRLLGLEIDNFQLIQVDAFSDNETLAFLNAKLPKGAWTVDETRLFMKAFWNTPAALELIAAYWHRLVEAGSKQHEWNTFKNDIAGMTASEALDRALRMSIDEVAEGSDGMREYKTLCAMLEEAKPRLLDGIEGSRLLYGRASKHGIKQRNALSRLYAHMGQYEEARDLLEETLRLCRREKFSETHPYIFCTLSSLATTQLYQGRVQESLETHRHAVHLAELSQSATADAVFEVRRGLALALSKSGEIAAAAEQQAHLVALCPQLEPLPGPRAMDAHLNLGITLERLSKYSDAQLHLEKARELCRVPPTDPTTLRIRNCLALVFLRQGRLVEAETEYRTLLAAQKALHPNQSPPHDDVLLMMNNLGGALQRQRMYMEAIEVQGEIFESVRLVPNSNLPWPRMAMTGGNNLAESFRLWAEEGEEDGDRPDRGVMLKRAESIHCDVLAERERQFGEVWPTWTSRSNVAMVLQAQGNLEAARVLYTDIEKLAGVVGEANPAVKMVRDKIALL